LRVAQRAKLLGDVLCRRNSRAIRAKALSGRRRHLPGPAAEHQVDRLAVHRLEIDRRSAARTDEQLFQFGSLPADGEP